MHINTQRQFKYPQKQLYTRKGCQNPKLDIRLVGSLKLVGFLIVTREDSEFAWGYLGTCTHDEYKANILQTLVSPEEVDE